MSHPQLKVLSLNCWGLLFVADKRRQRCLAIADWIAQSASTHSRDSYHSDLSDEASASAGLNMGSSSSPAHKGYDVIALQEIWVKEDFDVIALRAKEAGLKYSRFFYSGAIGAGLAILSAHPIVSSFMYPYPLNGHALHFIEGDFFAGKGVCGITVEVPVVGKVDVLNTHMYAPGGEGEGLIGAHRVAQAWELGRIVQEKAERGRHVILMGDLNSQPHSLIIRILTTHGTLTDSFLQTHPPPPAIDSTAHQSLSPTQVLHTHGITCDSPLNSYSAPKLAKRGRLDETVIRGGKRLDYVLYRSPESSADRLVAESTSVVLTELIPSLNVSYSDHFGLESVLSLVPSASLTNASGISILPLPPPLSTTDLSTSLTSLRSAQRHSMQYYDSQLKLLGVAIVLAPALAIAASFQPLRYLGWLWQAGALKNVIGELEAEMEGRRLEGGNW
ncbi:hypothetical protein MNV49_002822 [Pseudohyphozyma bogoriensis]|nr:hypothetical protein MNV49_002822 [Pseudohyphozyma bogoriensis]